MAIAWWKLITSCLPGNISACREHDCLILKCSLRGGGGRNCPQEPGKLTGKRGDGNATVCDSEAVWFPEQTSTEGEMFSRNSHLSGGGRSEPASGLLLDLNFALRGTLAFLANLWTVKGHLETACTSPAWLGAEPGPPAGDAPFVAEI